MDSYHSDSDANNSHNHNQNNEVSDKSIGRTGSVLSNPFDDDQQLDHFQTQLDQVRIPPIFTHILIEHESKQ